MTPALVATDATPVWATLLAGIGVGGLVTGLVAAMVSVWNGNRQRQHDKELRAADQEHDLKVRAQGFAHELAMQRLRDAQRRRDERLARLRQDLQEIVLVAFDLQKSLIATDLNQPSNRTELAKATGARFDAVRGRLLLDPVVGVSRR